jgi:hypothetical protein
MKVRFSSVIAIIISVSLAVSVLLISSQNSFVKVLSAIASNNGIIPEGEARSLPYFVDVHSEPKLKAGDAALGVPYFWIYPHWMDNFGERHCEECTMIEYSASGQQRQAGVAYQSDNLLDLTGAKRIKFYAMGELGGEHVSFMAVGKDFKRIAKDASDLPSRERGIFKDTNFGIKTEKVTLKDTWSRFEISLEDQELSDIEFPFALHLDGKNAGPNGNIRLYLKNIVIDSEEPQEPIPLNSTSTS